MSCGRFLQFAAATARYPPAVIGSGAKVGIVAAVLGQSAVHLGGAQPELARQRQKEMIGVGQVGAVRRCRAGSGLVQRVVEIAREIIERHASSRRPDCGQSRTTRRAPSAWRVLALVAGEISSIVPSSGGVLANPARSTRNRRHLDLRVRPGLQAPIDLEHAVFLEQHRAVRLLGPEPAHDQPLGRRGLVEERRLAEPDLAAPPSAVRIGIAPAARSLRSTPARNPSCDSASTSAPSRRNWRNSASVAGTSVCRSSLPGGRPDAANGRK